MENLSHAASKTIEKYCQPENWHYPSYVMPLMERGELDDLALDIQSNGLLNPIVRCEGKILDGRNRILACRIALREPRFIDVNGDVAKTWMVSQNFLRRHLKPNEEALARYTLELKLGGDRQALHGKERVRAYKTLGQLKESLTTLLDRAPALSSEEVTEELAVLLKRSSKLKPPRTFWEGLYYRLNALVPTISDGQEHALVVLLTEAQTAPLSAPADKAWKEYSIDLLERISKDFAQRANELRVSSK